MRLLMLCESVLYSQSHVTTNVTWWVCPSTTRINISTIRMCSFSAAQCPLTIAFSLHSLLLVNLESSLHSTHVQWICDTLNLMQESVFNKVAVQQKFFTFTSLSKFYFTSFFWPFVVYLCW